MTEAEVQVALEELWSREQLDSFCEFGDWEVFVDNDTEDVSIWLKDKMIVLMPFEAIKEIIYSERNLYRSNEISSVYGGTVGTLEFFMKDKAYSAIRKFYVDEGRF